MTPEDLQAYRNEDVAPEIITVSIADVAGPDRTLVYGYSRAYDAEHNETTHTVHVYKAEGQLHIFHYRNNRDRVTGAAIDPTVIYAVSGVEVLASECVPQKRAYPERCDLDFARLLRLRGNALCFTTFGGAGSASEGIFAGLLIPETTTSA